jgi:hypothetical protein
MRVQNCTKESRDFKCQHIITASAKSAYKLPITLPSPHKKPHIIRVGQLRIIVPTSPFRETLQECNFHENEMYAIKMAINGYEINLAGRV